MASPTPFQIKVTDADMGLLKKKLELARFPDEPEGFTVQQGVPLSDMKRLVSYWRNKYDWRKHEAELNKLPMFTAPISTEKFGELNIHFLHQKSQNPGAIPLLFVHGWPGSFIEATKLLPLLQGSNGPEPAFDIVAPSLPNYGFSDSVSKKGFGIRCYAEVCHKLMLFLGYNKYVTQGGDWGSIITRKMAHMYPNHICAYHINLAGARPINILWQPLRLLQLLVTPWSKVEKEGYKNGNEYLSTGNAYYRMQATRPQTVSYLLADSPIALLGWVWEKLIHWTDNYPWTDDEILTWISIYWFSKAGPGASVRTYYESENPPPEFAGDVHFWEYIPKIPLGIAYFPRDIVVIPRVMARTLGNVVHETWPEDGGHFASYERPQVLVDDLRKMFGKGGAAYGVVPGLDGYGEGKKSL